MSNAFTQIAYVATPYSKRGNLELAYREACILTARLIKTGIACYSPIVQGHSLATHGNIDPLDQEFWGRFNLPMLYVCRTLIVAHLEGWEVSSGIGDEIKFFEDRGRPIFDLVDLRTLRMEQRRHVEAYQPAIEFVGQ